MTALAHDANVAWFWATAVASPAAPTVANIAAATRLTNVTNYDTPSSEAEVDYSDIDDMYDTSGVGTTKAGPVTLTFKRQRPINTDTMWALFNTPRANGFLIKSIDGVVTAGSSVEVYPVQVGQRRSDGYARNTAQKFQVAFYVTDDPEMDAVVAA